MTEPLIVRVRNALDNVINPKTGRSIVADGLVRGLAADEAGVVRFALEVDASAPAGAEALLEKAQAAAGAVEGARRVAAVATAHRREEARDAPPAPKKGPAPQGGAHANPFGLKTPHPAAPDDRLGAVARIIAVASGKGGVGKSTLAANLAVALAKAGHRTGLLDADIYGPSAPTLFGIAGAPELRDGVLQPVDAFGVKVMSIGLLVDPEQALAWRGPMVMGALKQLMRDVEWGALDYLIVDTPPGTGDAQLSLIQSKRLTGAVIVSTPQDLALADVRRGVALFRKTEIPILGVVENMAWLEGTDGARQHLFGEGGAERAARDLGAPFLGALPIMPDLRAACDAGTPLAAGDHPLADEFRRLAEKVAAATAH